MQGRTIILSIHQPRFKIFQMFDSVTLLSNGSFVYHGPTSQVIPYFASVGFACGEFNNPADYVLDVINGDETLRMYAGDPGVDHDMLESEEVVAAIRSARAQQQAAMQQAEALQQVTASQKNAADAAKAAPVDAITQATGYSNPAIAPQ